MTRRAQPGLVFSVDIEADGPIPGPYSMLSFGLCVVGMLPREGGFVARDDLRADTCYRELRPISDQFLPEAVAVTGLDRDRLVAEGDDPAVAMAEAAQWVEAVAAAGPVLMRPVLIGWPLAFDWMFLHWYWLRFGPGDPFGHAALLDIKSLVWARTGLTLDKVAKSSLPEPIRADAAHTHHALDDAVEQAEIFVKLMAWKGQSAPDPVPTAGAPGA